MQSEPPDPLSAQERDDVLADMESHYPDEIVNLYRFAFFSGLRTSELLALRWEVVDFRKRVIVVRRAIVLKRTKTTKSNRIRQVELVDEAVTALTRQKSHSFMAGSAVFLSPLDALPFTADQTLRKKYWVPSLKRAGVRERGPYHTRHTYATAVLIAGCNVAWVAKQLGYSTPATTLAKYARWIEGDDAGRELSKLQASLTRRANETNGARRA